MRPVEKVSEDHGIHGVEWSHPSFGLISLTRIVGHERPLFGVDFPQSHLLELCISHATHTRSISNDWFHDKKPIIRVAMSETQWARLLCSANAGGVPCTLLEMIDGDDWKIVPAVEHDTGAQGDLHKAELKERADDAVEAVREAKKKLEAVIANPAATKTKLREIVRLLETAERQAVANLNYVVDQAGEAIEKAKQNAMGEVDAHIALRLQQLGGEALRKQIAPGVERRSKTLPDRKP